MTEPSYRLKNKLFNRPVFLILAVVAVAGATLVRLPYLGPQFRGSTVSGNALVQSELQVAAKQAEVCSSRNAPGVGLRGEYFPETGFSGKPLLTRVDTTVDFNRLMEWPEALSTKRPSSVRWTGWIRPPIAGAYIFHVSTPSALVTISNQVVFSSKSGATTPMELAAGRYYPVQVDVDDLANIKETETIKFEWTAPHGMRYVIPRALMYLPSATASK